MDKAKHDDRERFLADNTDPSDLGPDITACDREPIHVPGSIQPHGLLLIVDASSLKVIGGAGAIEAEFGDHWLGANAEDLLGQPLRARLTDNDLLEGTTSVLEPVYGMGQRYGAVMHQTSAALLVELEPQSEQSWSAARMLVAIDAANTSFERAPDLVSLCDAAATAFRELTGYDRVMIYRFLDDAAGTVVAESRIAGIGSFLNHHFPASDIPQQARRLYVHNRVRVIPDIGYTPAPLRPEAQWRDLDLSCAGLRSVSPVHLQYLANMGIAASASISIVQDGELWGLIACHAETPRTIPFDRRMAARALASGLARQIRAKEEADTFRERIRLRGAEDAVVALLGTSPSLESFLAEAGEDLRKMMGADGFAALQGNDLFTWGVMPPEALTIEIGRRVAPRALERPVATANLASLIPEATPHQAVASGLLAVTKSTEEPTVLMWFRAETVQTINWAGNPHKAVDLKEGETLTPRASFEAWSDAVSGQSRPWTLGEIEAAVRIKRTLFEARQSRRLRELNRELTQTVADKEALLTQKDFLMREVNHRVQNSLQLVGSFLALQSRTATAETAASLGEAQRRLSAVALVHRRLYVDDALQTVDLGRYLEDLVREMGASMDGAWTDQMKLDLAPILISTDRAVNVGLILTELVINANKYAYRGAPGPIHIQLEKQRNRFRLIVADRGVGKTDARQGFGTRVLKAMIARLAGTIEEQDNMPGLRVVLSAPIEES